VFDGGHWRIVDLLIYIDCPMYSMYWLPIPSPSELAVAPSYACR
jgi:hypothetical protein